MKPTEGIMAYIEGKKDFPRVKEIVDTISLEKNLTPEEKKMLLLMLIV